jgi:hypothetical protein
VEPDRTVGRDVGELIQGPQRGLVLPAGLRAGCAKACTRIWALPIRAAFSRMLVMRWCGANGSALTMSSAASSP